MATIVLGVTGGIAAYKAIDTVRALRRSGHDVHVVMTQAARRFVGAASFAALSGNPVGSSVFGPEDQPDYRHLDLARSGDVLLVAPASANTIARMAAGLADDLLTSVCLAFDGPVIVAPAMNTRMWEHPGTIANIATLRARGVTVVPPGAGLLADGDVGPGRLAETADIVAAVDGVLGAAQTLTGVRVLVTAGGTREPIDAVRYVGNRSSGRMGFAIAEAAHDRGAQVTVIAANVDLPRATGIRYVDVETAAELGAAASAAFADCHILVMAAAVADYRPAGAVDGKIDKSATDALTVTLEPTDDILTGLAAAAAPGQVLVGFAAEHGAEGVARARGKLERKRLHLIVHNDVAEPGIGFESEDNAVTILGPGDAERTVARTSKRAVAEAILDAAVPLLATA